LQLPPPSEPEPDFFNIRDIKDYPVLYSAIIEDVDLFVTGDNDFDDVDIEKPTIITPSEFLEKYWVPLFTFNTNLRLMSIKRKLVLDPLPQKILTNLSGCRKLYLFVVEPLKRR